MSAEASARREQDRRRSELSEWSVDDLTLRVYWLEEALKPFAEMAESYKDDPAAFVVASKGGTIVSVSNLRDAAKALRK